MDWTQEQRCAAGYCLGRATAALTPAAICKSWRICENAVLDTMTATTANAPPHRATYTDWSPSDKMEPGDSLRLSIALYPGYLPQISTAKSAKVATLKCSDCGKPDVHLTDFFLVPDKVWDALCPLDAIVCLGCFGKRLNPANPPQDQQHLGAEIRRQRKRFKLKNVNRWLGEKRAGEVYRGRYLVLLDWEPKAAETVAGLDEGMLKKGMTSKRVHETAGHL
jgi:hypothetical protein